MRLAMNTHMAERTRVTEPISMARHRNVSYRARAWSDENLGGLRRWAETVESEGCALLGQVQDPGREYAHVHGGEVGVIADVAFVAYATPRLPEHALAAPLGAAGIEVHRVGDCALPLGLLAATTQGHAAGMTV